MDDFSLNPPDARRVAARALVLSAVCCRGFIEKDSLEPEAEVLRQTIVGWLDYVGVAYEVEPSEALLLSTPLGKLDGKATVDATWRSEGMVVLAWALHSTELPPVHAQCEPSDVANGMGFLDDSPNTVLHNPRLRDPEEIERWTDTYLTLHWRLREFSQRPGPIDFVKFVSECNWGPLRLDGLEIVDRDLAVNGVRVDRLREADFRQKLSITQERHAAFNWLLGFELLYSQITTDT
jgi:hypothetical protein